VRERERERERVLKNNLVFSNRVIFLHPYTPPQQNTQALSLSLSINLTNKLARFHQFAIATSVIEPRTLLG